MRKEEIKITYIDDKVISATLNLPRWKIFLPTTTAELYMNNVTQK
jgi:uncharacterized membrane-anchored protein